MAIVFLNSPQCEKKGKSSLSRPDVLPVCPKEVFDSCVESCKLFFLRLYLIRDIDMLLLLCRSRTSMAGLWSDSWSTYKQLNRSRSLPSAGKSTSGRGISIYNSFAVKCRFIIWDYRTTSSMSSSSPFFLFKNSNGKTKGGVSQNEFHIECCKNKYSNA